MSLIADEAHARRTVLIHAREKDGSSESREIEPYSVRPGKDTQRLMFFCLKKNGWRSVLVPNILSAEATGHAFTPRVPVEF